MKEILVRVKEICQKFSLDYEKEEKYLNFYLPHICQTQNITIDSERITNWLNGYYLNNLAFLSSQYKHFYRKCLMQHYEGIDKYIQHYGKPPTIFSFETTYGPALDKYTQRIAEQMGKIRNK